MVAAVSTTLNPKATTRSGPPQNPTRPPLLPSDPDNAVSPHRRSKSRQVTSRYMSSSSSSISTPSSTSNSRRCPSPLVSRTTTMTPMPSVSSLAKRSQSVERRRTATPRPSSLDSRAGSGNGEVSAAQKLLFTSARSLSVSFQGESFSLQVSKAKPAPSPSPSVRKGTPERRKATTPARAVDKTENSRLGTDQQRWPARLRQANCMSRSLDCTDERKKVGGPGSVVRALQSSMADVRVSSFDGRLGSESEKTVEFAVVGDSGIGSAEARWSDPVVASDTESVSSGSTSGAQDNGGGDGGQGPRVPRGIMVPARFLQDAHNRLRRQPEPCSPSAKNVGTKTMAPPKLIAPKKLSIDCPVLSPRGVVNSRGQLSPVRGAVRPASPSKLGTSAISSPLRGSSPCRIRNAMAGTPNSYLSNTPSILSFAADIRSGKIGDNRIVDAHLLRLLHNRFLQWRFVNARAGAALSVQRLNAEMTYLEEWALMDWDYSSSLSGATEALKASTLRLPVVGGAKADVQNVKDAICSAVDVMQAMASSICLLLSKVGDVNSLVAELAKISVKERALLHQGNDLLSTIAAMQVTECSLRTHAVQQLKRQPSNLTQ
ncbi:QWRF motif-containing protein 2-like isoform X2 [Carya illinoinensis]|uniref:QWRF motif-containing protein 2-like isoform X2 n=1 Tax=Carya illinoinensis TaxID=32201 RepID=UPI001C7209F6|nr:QWRF motif-containing protein 2-like isoform X2 [Carya illinoinensis]